MPMMKFRVWCLSWEDDEETGMDLVGYDPMKEERPSATRTAINVPFYSLSDAEDAAETYADYCIDNRDGWDSSWPLTFRVRLPDGSTEDYEVELDTVPEFTARKVR